MTAEEKLELLKQCRMHADKFDKNLHYIKVDMGNRFPGFKYLYILKEKNRKRYEAIFVGPKSILYYNGEKAVQVEEIKQEYFSKEYSKDEYKRKYGTFRLIDFIDWEQAIKSKNFDISEKNDQITVKLKGKNDSDVLNSFTKGGTFYLKFDQDNYIKEVRFIQKNPQYQKHKIRYRLSDYNTPKFDFKINEKVKEAFEKKIAFPDLSIYNLDIFS